MEWQVTLPCLPAMVPVVRKLARGLITDCPRTDDAELILSELSGSTVRYGVGALSISLAAQEGLVRLEVTDLGIRPDVARRPVDSEEVDATGRGMAIVDAIADRWGHQRNTKGHNTLWAELDW